MYPVCFFTTGHGECWSSHDKSGYIELDVQVEDDDDDDDDDDDHYHHKPVDKTVTLTWGSTDEDTKSAKH
jgi:hypothetical protein